MKVAFVGVGKLGRDSAEVIAKYYDVVGYDTHGVDTTIEMKSNLAAACKNRDLIFVAVPTPHHHDYDGRYPTSHLPPKDFDYTIVKQTISLIDKYCVDRPALIALISTVLPGTVRREIAPLVQNCRFIYNPYLIAQGTVKWDVEHPEMIIIGTEDGGMSSDAKLLVDFYKKFIKESRFEVGTWEEAEAIKVFYNTFISTKITFVNMIGDVAERVGNMDADVVCGALKRSTMRIVTDRYFTPGLPDGGGCHPRDNIALRYMAQELNLGYDLFDAIMKTREQQALLMAKRIKEFGNKNVCILGRSYKPGVDQPEGSGAILVGYNCINIGLYVHYDGESPITEPITYVMHDHERFHAHDFNRGSVIFDPFGKTKQTKDLTNKGIIVYNYGRPN